MARPKKQGLAYYPRDTDFFQDRIIRTLVGKYGCKGVCIYEYLLDSIYNDKGYYIKWDDDLRDVLTADLHINDDNKEGYIDQVLNYLLKRSLFDDTLFKSVKVLSGKSIQERYQSAKAKLSSETEVNADYWLLSKENTLSCIKVTQNSDKNAENPNKNAENPNKNAENSLKEKKRNEKKVKENIKRKVIEIPTEIQPAWDSYVEMRKTSKKPLTDKAKELALKKLNTLAPNDYQMQIQILEQSIFHTWIGLFPLKDDREVVSDSGDYQNFVPSRRNRSE